MFGEDVKVTTTLIDEKYLPIISEFRCGNEVLDNYLYEKALLDFSIGESATKLILNQNKTEVLGYYTICCSVLDINKYYPAIEIKMFAINEKLHRMIYSEGDSIIFSDSILSKVINDIINISETRCGVRYITLYSITDAVNFYNKNGFERFDEYECDIKTNRDRYVEGCTPMLYVL